MNKLAEAEALLGSAYGDITQHLRHEGYSGTIDESLARQKTIAESALGELQNIVESI